MSETIKSCTGAINDLKMKLKKFEDSPSPDKTERLRQFAHRLQYPFEKTTLLEMKANISDIRSELTLAMAILQMDISLRSSRTVDLIDQHLTRDVIPGIQGIQTRENDRVSKEERSTIFSWLSKLSPSTFVERQNASLSRRKKDTGAWIFENEEMTDGLMA